MIFTHRHGSWDFGPGARARVVGILNLTPDSFYDGGRYADAGRDSITRSASRRRAPTRSTSAA